MKKNSKKLIVAILVIVCVIVGFNMGASRGRYSVDDAIIEVAKRYTKSTSYDEVNSNVTPLIRIEKNDTDYYMGDGLQLSSFYVDIYEQSSCIVVSRLIDDQSTPYNIHDLSIFDTQVLKTSQYTVFKYIDYSNVFKNKESIKKFLSNITIKCSSFKEEDRNSYYDSESNTIYIRPTRLCKSTIINEYINAISYYTHGRKLGEYRYTKLNQIITNLIATGLSRESYHLDYMAYSPLVYPYINLFGDKAIEAYFYGYDDIYKAIPKEEFDFWIAVVDNFDEGVKEYYDDLMLKWYSCNTL